MIELLVVISIIAILMALLMPSAAGILERSREAMCANNEKQIVLACINYAGDHDGRLPNNKEWVQWVNDISNPTYVTNGLVYPYLRDMKVYLCPSFYRIVRPATPSAKRSYSMNYRVALKSDTQDGPQYHVETMGSVRRPGGSVMISEENPNFAPWTPVFINGERMSNIGVDDARLCWANNSEYWDNATVRNAPGTFHRKNSAMAAFFDGHTESFIMDQSSKWKYKMEPTAP